MITMGKILDTAYTLARKLGYSRVFGDRTSRLERWDEITEPDRFRMPDRINDGKAHLFCSEDLRAGNRSCPAVEIPNIYVSDGCSGECHFVCTLSANGESRVDGFVIRIRNGHIYEAALFNKRKRTAETELTLALKELLS